MKINKLLLIIFLSLSYPLSAQEVTEDYISEFIYGININTNGGLIGGIMFKGTKIIKPKVYRSLGVEIVGIKNPKETRFFSNRSGNSFIYGKRNYFFSIRPQYGRDFILFRKAPEDGIQIAAVFAAGPSLGLQIPYHIIYDFVNEGTRSEQYDPNIHTSSFNILGSGNFLEGLGGTEFLIGAHAKIGASLDFGAFRNSITGLEIGFTFEAFTNRPEILVDPSLQGEVKNNQIFTGAYANIFFGSRK